MLGRRMRRRGWLRTASVRQRLSVVEAMATYSHVGRTSRGHSNPCAFYPKRCADPIARKIQTQRSEASTPAKEKPHSLDDEHNVSLAINLLQSYILSGIDA